MQSAEFPDVDLSHGIAVGGRLTEADVRAAVALRPVKGVPPPPDRKPSKTFWFWIVLCLFALLWLFTELEPAPPGVVVGPPPKVVEKNQNERFFFPFALASGVAVVILPVWASIKYARKKQDPTERFPQCEWLFQDDVFYSATVNALEQHRWDGLTVRESSDLLVLENPDESMHIVPRHFAAEEEAWNEIRALVHRKLPTAASVKPSPALNPTPPASPPVESVNVLDGWVRFLLRSPIVGQSTGPIEGAEVISHLLGWRNYRNLWIPLVVSLPAAIAGFAVVTNELFRGFFVTVGVASVLVLLLIGWLIRVQRRRYRATIDAHADLTTTVSESYVVQQTLHGRCFYRWNVMRRRPSSDDVLMLKIGNSDQTLLLVKRLFRPTEWSRIWARAASLPNEDA